MIVCKICGFDNEPGAQFCGSCGGFLEWTGEQPTPETPPGPTTPPTPTPPTTSGTGPLVSPDTPTTVYSTTPEPVDPNQLICPSCGLANDRDRVFCRRCAAELVPLATEPIGPTTVAPRRPSLPVPAGPAILVGAFGVVALIGIALFATGIIGRNGGLVAATSSPSVASVPPSNPATASVGPSASASPSLAITPPPAPTGEIAFSSSINENADIVVGQADGSGITRLIEAAGDDVQPAWSPDGTRIAFAAKNGIRIANVDGTKGIQFTNHAAKDRKPEWSPDNKIIAFASSRDKDFDIYLRHVGDDDLIRLTNVRGPDFDPSWSAVHDRIAFVSGRDEDNDIWTMNPDGKGLEQLTGPGSREDDPAWSPNGEQIAYATDEEGTFFIYLMNADGSNPHRLSSGTDIEHDPAWSPDGKFIAFARAGRIVIASVDDGSEVDSLGEDGASSGFPDWH